MLQKLKIIIMVISLLITNVFGNVFAGVVVFSSLNFGNKNIFEIDMVKQFNQIAVMPSKFADMCVMLENEFTNFGLSNTKKEFITKYVENSTKHSVLILIYRVNNIVKHIKCYLFETINTCSNNTFKFILFLMMLSFITGYLGFLTAKNKTKNIFLHINGL